MNKYLGPFLIFCFFLTPNIVVYPGLPALRVEDIFLVFIFISSVAAGTKNLSGGVRGNKFVFALSVMAYFSIFSLGMQQFVFGNDVSVNDFMIIVMIIKYIIILKYFERYLINDNNYLLLVGSILIANIIAALFGVAQYHNFAKINEWLSPFYTTADMTAQYADGVFFDIRVVGTHGDPRHYAYLLLSGLSLAFVLIYHRVPFRYKNLSYIAILVSILSIIYTATRTALISITILLLISMFLFSRYSKEPIKRYLNIILLFSSTAFAILYFKTSNFEKRVLTLQGDSYESSKYARIRDLRVPFETALEQPSLMLFGRGPAKGFYRTDSHNDFGWIFQRYGLPGLAGYVYILFCALKFGIKKYKIENDNYKRIMYFAALLNTINWIIFAMAENIFKDIHLMPINMMFLGVLSLGSMQNAEKPVPLQEESLNLTLN